MFHVALKDQSKGSKLIKKQYKLLIIAVISLLTHIAVLCVLSTLLQRQSDKHYFNRM